MNIKPHTGARLVLLDTATTHEHKCKATNYIGHVYYYMSCTIKNETVVITGINELTEKVQTDDSITAIHTNDRNHLGKLPFYAGHKFLKYIAMQ